MFGKTTEINNTRACMKIKILFSDNITFRVLIKMKIILNWFAVVIIFIKRKLLLSMNLVESEANLLKY